MKKKNIKKSDVENIYDRIPKNVSVMKKNKMTGQYEIIETDIPNPNIKRLESIDYEHEFDKMYYGRNIINISDYVNEYIGFDGLDICGGVEDIPYRREYDDSPCRFDDDAYDETEEHLFIGDEKIGTDGFDPDDWYDSDDPRAFFGYIRTIEDHLDCDCG